jgi:hypothetical protein
MNDVTSAAGAPGGDGAAASAAVDAAAATGLASAETAAASPSTAAAESASAESTPSLLSSAAGKIPDQPAPAADATPAAKAAETPDAKPTEAKPTEKPVKPDDPGKTAEAKADAATDPAKDATANVPPAQVSVEDLKLPEGVSLDAEQGKAFVELLNNADLSGKDRGQALIDLHQKEITRVHGELVNNQRKVWDDLNTGWKNELRNDPELGGNRLNTSLSMAKAVLQDNTSDADLKAILSHTDLNGMGNFPPFIRFLNAIGKKLNVFEDSIAGNARPQAPKRGPGQRGWYDKTPGMQGT